MPCNATGGSAGPSPKRGGTSGEAPEVAQEGRVAVGNGPVARASFSELCCCSVAEVSAGRGVEGATRQIHVSSAFGERSMQYTTSSAIPFCGIRRLQLSSCCCDCSVHFFTFNCRILAQAEELLQPAACSVHICTVTCGVFAKA